MTAVHDRPTTNGKPQRSPDETTTIDLPTARSDNDVSAKQREVENKRRSVELQRELVNLDDQAAFLQRRHDDKDAKGKDDTAVSSIRDMERRDWKRQRKAAIRRSRTERWRAFFDDRAERVRSRITDPARAVGSIHRTWVSCAALMMVIIGGALLYLTDTVKNGVVGENGSFVGYFIEPMASAMLCISLVLQTRAYRQGIKPGGAFIAIDAFLCITSIVLVTVPFGLRYGFAGPELVAHIAMPVLATFGVLLWHAGASLTSKMMRQTTQDPELESRLALLRRALQAGDLPVELSKNKIENYLREISRDPVTGKGGISRVEAEKAASHFLGK